MKKFPYIHSSLLASSLLLSTALSASAHASDDRSLPNLSPSEISRDVTREYNNRTGTQEFIAPTFDPFEQDTSMAGAVSLRSVGTPVTTIDGEVLADGVMLDMNFYYNSPSDDPYDIRGFTDAAFLSGSLAPAVRRNNRILECSRNVEKVVYDHRYYTSPLFIGFGLNRGFRRYSGHRGYGRFDRPYWRNRGYGSYGHGVGTGRSWGRTTYPRGNRTNDRDNNRSDRARNNRNADAARDRGRTDRDRNDRNRNDRDRTRDRRASSTIPAVRMDRNGRMRGSVSRGNERAINQDRTRDQNQTRNQDRARNQERIRNQDRARNEERNRNSNANRVRTNERAVNADRRDRSNRTRNVENRARTVPANTDRNNTARQRDQSRADRREMRGETRNNRGRASLPATANTERAVRRSSGSDRKNNSAQRSQSQSQQQSAPKQRSASKQRSAPKSRSAPKARSNNNRRSNTTINRSAPKARNRSEGRQRLNFFPGGTSYGRDVVRNVSVDCAREESLSIFIPARRLDAARFDGLTILALDNRGQEYPVFVPPNYIEGFKQAMGGNYIRHNGTAVQPSYRPETYSTKPYSSGTYSTEPYSNEPYSTSPYRQDVRPQPRLEAVCPSGTTKQSDGTCLLVNGSYPR